MEGLLSTGPTPSSFYKGFTFEGGGKGCKVNTFLKTFPYSMLISESDFGSKDGWHGGRTLHTNG